MSGRSRKLGRRYADISQLDNDDEEHELNPMNSGSPPDKTPRETSPAAVDRVDSGLLHHHRSHPWRRGRNDAEDEGISGAENPDVGYRYAHRDFQRHYGSGGGAPAWTRTPTFRADGLGELQTYYQSMGPTAQGQLARKHDHRKQYIKLMGKVLLRWFASFILACAMVIAFYEYEKVKILTVRNRRWFNALSTGLYLTLGLNLAASLKGMAIIVRWKLLARKPHDLEEIDFILGLSSLIKVSRYGVHIMRKRPVTATMCFGWILFNAVSRLSVALTGLTYSYDSQGGVYLHPGVVNITDWSSFAERDTVSRSWVSTAQAERSSAHQWGLFSVVLQYQDVTKPGVSDPNYPYEEPIEIAPDGTFVYYFRERNPKLKAGHIAMGSKSNRYVNVTASCEYYPLVRGQYGNSTTVVYRNGTVEHDMDGISNFGPNSTTWINPRDDLRNRDCGHRCASVGALSFLSAGAEPGPGAFYDCEVHVSDVLNATDHLHEMPDNVAIIAAGAIGLEGYSTGPDNWEYVRYSPESPWSNFGVNQLAADAPYMAQLASRFAVGAIAAKDIFGTPTAQAPGQLASMGVLLKIKWHFLLLILGTILLVQLLLGCATVTYANTVFCKDDSYLSTARLLRPIVERLGPSGCAMTGRDIAHTLKEPMVYGIRTDEGGTRHHLDLGEDIPVKRWFPEGWYDGYEEWVDVREEAQEKEPVRVIRKKKTTIVRRRRPVKRVAW